MMQPRLKHFGMAVSARLVKGGLAINVAKLRRRRSRLASSSAVLPSTSLTTAPPGVITSCSHVSPLCQIDGRDRLPRPK